MYLHFCTVSQTHTNKTIDLWGHYTVADLTSLLSAMTLNITSLWGIWLWGEQISTTGLTIIFFCMLFFYLLSIIWADKHENAGDKITSCGVLYNLLLNTLINTLTLNLHYKQVPKVFLDVPLTLIDWSTYHTVKSHNWPISFHSLWAIKNAKSA